MNLKQIQEALRSITDRTYQLNQDIREVNSAMSALVGERTVVIRPNRARKSNKTGTVGLTAEVLKAREIVRSMNGKRSVSKLSRKFGISDSTIKKIVETDKPFRQVIANRIIRVNGINTVSPGNFTVVTTPTQPGNSTWTYNR